MKVAITILLIVLVAVGFSQTTPNLLNQNLLYPDGIKNNPVVHSEDEVCKIMPVEPGSLSGISRAYRSVSIPTYMLFPAADSVNKQIALVIFPGGGLVYNWLDKEGTDLAMYLAAKGITCMVVKYRTNLKNKDGAFTIPFETYKKAVLEDASEAILKMKHFADSLNFDANKVGIIGFSAGAWISSRISIENSIDNLESKPAFTGLVYGGERVESLEEVKDKSKLPPFFIAIGRDDNTARLTNLLDYYSTLISEVNNSELHIFSKGQHGFALGDNYGHSVQLWKNNFYAWLLDIFDK